MGVIIIIGCPTIGLRAKMSWYTVSSAMRNKVVVPEIDGEGRPAVQGSREVNSVIVQIPVRI